MSSARASLRDRVSLRERRAVASLEPLEPRRLLANIVVNTAVDESIANATTSLREAMAQAAGSGADDVITFSATAFPFGSSHTITLTAGQLSIPSGGGKMTIDGPGPATLTVDGDGASRVFNVAGGANAVIQDITITDGHVIGDGGAIANAGTLLLSNVTLTGNLAEGAAGSIIAPAGGSAHGGAISNSGHLIIEASRVTDNVVRGGAGASTLAGDGDGGVAQGGAVFSAGGTLQVRRTDLVDNQARGGAGELGFAGGGLGGVAEGGAIYVSGSALSVADSSLQSNRAVGGAGGAALAAATAGGAGGDANGGAIYVTSSSATISWSDVESNSATAGAGGGGAIGAAGGTARGGAIVATDGLSILGGSLADNAAIGGASTTGSAGGGIGGALYNSGTVSIALGVLFDNNTSLGGQSTSGAGGGAHGGAIANDDQIDIDHAVIRSNIAIGGGGGSAGGVAEGAGVFNDSAGHVTIADSTITNNLAAAGSVASAPTGVAGARAAGGGIRNDGGVLAITRSTIDNNQALGGSGGTGTAGNGGAGGDGIGGGISNSGNLDLTNSTLYANAADGALGGGATLFSGAGGKALGGGIHNSGSIDLINVTLVANAAHGGAGGTSGIPGAAGEARGGAIYNQENASLINTIVADNTTTQGNPDLGGTSFTLIHSLISANADSFGATPTPASTGNFFGVPANLGPFQDNGGPTKTFEPLAGSLAIDNGDNPVAIAQFGIGGTDQRGRDRYVGTVDIGSVEVQAPPQIKVTGGGWDIANNDTTPRVADGTDFGAVAQGAPSRQQLFMVFNTGGHTLETLAPALPAGYTIVEPLDTTLAPGAFDSFTVALSTAAVGTFGGEVVISSNDPDDATFKFAITGKVTPSAGAAIKINFQPAGRPVPAGYLADFGAVFGSRGNGFSYGWNLSAGSFTRDRGINPDQKFDTFVHTQLFGSRTWEIGVPVGTYSVKIVAGDPQFFDSVYKINVEGQLAVNGTPTSGSRFITGAKNVTVIDGKLTITNASGSANNKIAFVEITPITTGVKINFQPVGRPIPTGYFADTGALFGNRGNGFSYGWNATASSFARDRNAFGVDQQYDTFIHTQLFGERTWELGVANGTYEVRIVAGDPNYFDSVYKFNVEGLLTVNGTPSSGSRFVEGMRTVTVTDGKLTITNASGSVNNKIAFVEVFAV